MTENDEIDYDAPDNHWKAPSREFLISKLDEILAYGRAPIGDSGWADVPDEVKMKLVDFYSYVTRAVSELDADGDKTLQTYVYDRKQGENPFAWIFLPHDISNPQQMIDYMRSLSAASSIVSSRITQLASSVYYKRDGILADDFVAEVNEKERVRDQENAKRIAADRQRPS